MDQPKTLTVPEAGRVYFDLGRNATYEAARRGDIPTIRIGRLLRVPVVADGAEARGDRQMRAVRVIEGTCRLRLGGSVLLSNAGV